MTRSLVAKYKTLLNQQKQTLQPVIQEQPVYLQ